MTTTDHRLRHPLVSVVIPTYNQAAMLLAAIQSVCDQTYRPIEIVVVDDGSTDDTAEQLAPLAADGTIQYVYQQNARQAAARNRGIAHSNGELIAFLDHDDAWEPTKLEHQVPLFNNPRVGLVYCGAREIDLAGNTLWEKGIEKYRRGNIFDSLLHDHFITNSSVVIRRSVLRDAGMFCEPLYGVDDIHQWLKICHDHEADYVPDILVACRNHDANMKHDPTIIPEKRFYMLTDIFERYGLDRTATKDWRRLRAEREFFLGYHIRERSHLQAMRHHFRSLRLQPSTKAARALLKLLTPGYYTLAKRLQRTK